MLFFSFLGLLPIGGIMVKKGYRILFVLSLVFFLFSCSTNKKIIGINFSFDVKPVELSDYSFIKMDFKYEFDGKYKRMKKDYKVFVHFWRIKSKEMLLQDDHYPVQKSFKWDKNTDLHYDRTIFMPKFIDDFYDIDFNGYEEIDIIVGLYRPDNKEDRHVLFKKRYRFKPASEVLPDIMYYEGWNAEEVDQKCKELEFKSWRWTRKEAICKIENTKKKSTLIIRGGVDKSKFKDQEIIFMINDQIIDQFIPSSGKFEKKYTISEKVLGEQEEIILKIKTNKSFIPSSLEEKSADKRELGVQIYFLYFNESL
jgi:hypothetical protein